jgi:3-phosphoshikimate 1-carboxyvinyltransferase
MIWTSKLVLKEMSLPFIQTKEVASTVMTVESDWSSASYFFSIVALTKNSTISLSSYKETSLQGDSALVEIYNKWVSKRIFKETK